MRPSDFIPEESRILRSIWFESPPDHNRKNEADELWKWIQCEELAEGRPEFDFLLLLFIFLVFHQMKGVLAGVEVFRVVVLWKYCDLGSHRMQ